MPAPHINVRSVRHLQRYREIAQVLIHHGLGELAELLELLPYLSLPGRIAERRGRQAPSPLGIAPRMRMALEDLGPTFVKLGQVLSTRPDLLPPAYIVEFSKLQSAVPAGPWEPVQDVLENELGAPIEDFFATFHATPLAAASLSQVHAATLPDGREVVVKVQRPGIQAVVETDLEILFNLARLVQDRTPLGKLYDLPGIAEEFSATLRSELDFYREGHNADRFRENFAGEPHLHIPTIYWDYTTRRILVMERLRGIKVSDIEALDVAGYDRHRIATHAARILVKEMVEDGFFHADPHPGNFVVLPGEIIGAMDFGMVGYLSQQTRVDLARLYSLVVQMDEDSIIDQLIRVGAVSYTVDRSHLRRDLVRLIRKYHGMPLGDVSLQGIMGEVLPIAFRHHINLPAELWLVGKTLTMMEGVGFRLDPDFDAFAVFKPYLQRFMLERALPGAWIPVLIKSSHNWQDFLGLLPRVGYDVLSRIQRGDVQVTIEHKGLPNALSRLDHVVNRLSLSLLLAALIVGLALLVPLFNPEGQWNLATVLVITSFVGVSLLGLTLIFSIWRSR
ncbi:MAG: AarF/ABC1/UbiB kinase family protein [Chloroflexi bacterium]|nr:AarF/ABC1/UbiB kinase family protein [Chloroflexota bacterium]